MKKRIAREHFIFALLTQTEMQLKNLLFITTLIHVSLGVNFPISIADFSSTSIVLPASNGVACAGMNVVIETTHPAIGELSLKLRNDASGRYVNLMENPGAGYEREFQCLCLLRTCTTVENTTIITFSDDGVVFADTCSGNATITFKPLQSLANFALEDCGSSWTLTVTGFLKHRNFIIERRSARHNW